MRYNPAATIDASQWLAIEEEERLLAIQRWISELTGSDIEDCLLEAVPILAVENQVAMDSPPITAATLERLLDAGINRMTAIQAMSDVMADSLRAAVSGQKEASSETIARALEQIDPVEISRDEPKASDEERMKPVGNVPKFSDQHRQMLADFGERHAADEVMSWPETAGFLFAVQACPDLVMPSEWTEIVQGKAVFSGLEEARAVSEARMALMNWISDRVGMDQSAIPFDCRPDPQPMRILEADNDFSRWCRGVTAGHFWLQQSWDEALQKDSEEDRSQSMAMILFSFFTGRTMAEHVVQEMARDRASGTLALEELADQLHPLIDDAVQEYAAVGLAHRSMPSAPPPKRPVRAEKIGRNQPCPCGSGKKYKKCCGRPGARNPN